MDLDALVGEGWSIWPAPAKLNLFLHITGRRPDGYHALQTVFHLLDWGDRVALRPRADGRIGRVGEVHGVDPDADLTVRAARALQAATGVAAGADVAIDKRIPLGAGLGGGSSDAATVLVALNRLWRTGLAEDDLATIGLALGADVPVFVRGRSAFAEGVGERLQPLALPPRWYLVVHPGVHVSTATLFQDAQLTRDTPATTISRFLSGEAVCNAFEPLVRRRHGAVARVFEWLEPHGVARLSGSGSAVFMPVDDAQTGLGLARDCPPGMTAVVARGVDRSPLHLQLERWKGN
ncbi:MAG: 4-(cytidine 5'-diphospho)-2-C-methyl-D-erythritol kinase [Rhodanobacter denitrificans]|uniref:4-diphosphocytidyl-2-C-methyl-D-erythritol kinase n=1 Tax=Rhodanobacter denitrificans TaxID=666685 RepID=A0A2W5KQA1_9GAMM|nr:MAG: 4-(cytidine 5'-diphospho)-2-C-methyl-D-erythritol kinase [Rhodanobacter denitrificans]